MRHRLGVRSGLGSVRLGLGWMTRDSSYLLVGWCFRDPSDHFPAVTTDTDVLALVLVVFSVLRVADVYKGFRSKPTQMAPVVALMCRDDHRRRLPRSRRPGFLVSPPNRFLLRRASDSCARRLARLGAGGPNSRSIGTVFTSGAFAPSGGCHGAGPRRLRSGSSHAPSSSDLRREILSQRCFLGVAWRRSDRRAGSLP